MNTAAVRWAVKKTSQRTRLRWPQKILPWLGHETLFCDFFSRHGKKHRQLLTVTSWIHLTLSWRGHYHGTGFYMINTTVMKELICFWIAQVPWSLLSKFLIVLYLLSSLLHLFIYAKTRTTKIKHKLQLQLRKQFDINCNRLNERTLLSRRNFKFQRFKLNRFRADELWRISSTSTSYLYK